MVATAGEIMQSSIVTVSPEASVRDAAKLMAEKGIGCLLVESNEEMVGIVTERDMLKRVIAKGLSPDETLIYEVMTKELKTVDYDTDIYTISEIFNKQNIRRLPVTKDGKIVGILTSRDVINKLRYSYAKKEADSREYVRPEYGR